MMQHNERSAFLSARGILISAVELAVAEAQVRHGVNPTRAEGLAHAALADVLGMRLGVSATDAERIAGGGEAIDGCLLRLQAIIKDAAEQAMKGA